TVKNFGPHIAFLKELIESGKLRTVIGRRYTFPQIAQAHAYADTGHKVGSVLVLVDDANDPCQLADRIFPRTSGATGNDGRNVASVKTEPAACADLQPVTFEHWNLERIV